MILHLAIPVKDLAEAIAFYENLGCAVGRRYHEHAIIYFFGMQLVLHQSGKWDRDAQMYPRHFGVVTKSKIELVDLWWRWQYANFVFEEYFVRHEGKPEEHHTFFLVDPSNNVIEFKWYKNQSAVFT